MTPRPLVDYLVARGCMPPRSGLAYDYVLAGDGIFVAAENHFLRARVPAATAEVRGLPRVHAECSLLPGRIPGALWDRMARLARRAALEDAEILFAVTHEAERGYRLRLPPQAVTATSVHFLPSEDIVLELHSHGRAGAHFSPTDTADEQRLRLYGVLGRAESERPEVRLRVGAYGYFLPIPWSTVFDGDPAVVLDRTVDLAPQEGLDLLDAEMEGRLAPEEPNDAVYD